MKYLSNPLKILFYFRFVDDNFVILRKDKEKNKF